EDVRQQVAHHQQDGGDDDEPQHHVDVLRVERGKERRRDTGVGHDDLYQAGTADQARQQTADAGDEGDDGGPESVLVGHAALADPLGPGGPDEVRTDVLDHLGPEDPGEPGHAGSGDDERG